MTTSKPLREVRDFFSRAGQPAADVEGDAQVGTSAQTP